MTVPNEDAAIRFTDDDASISRDSAVKLGYLQDPFSSKFISRRQIQQAAMASGGGFSGTGTQRSTRPPLINIGTHLRTWSIDYLIDRFLSDNGSQNKHQIVSLGAGSDTRFFRLMDKNPNLCIRYLELDFDQITAKKARIVKTDAKMNRACVGNVNCEGEGKNVVEVLKGGSMLASNNYVLVPCDLRKKLPNDNQQQDVDPAQYNTQLVETIWKYLDPKVPTLVLAECVLVYMAPENSMNLLSWFANNFEHVGAISYEMVNPNDQFGQVMVHNLKARGLSLPGLVMSPTIESQAERFKKAGFNNADAHSLLQVRQSDLDKEELQRVSKLEMLDEVEELNLILSHYAIAWASKSTLSSTESPFKDFYL